MKLITNTTLFLAASAATATTTHGSRDNHQNQPHQLNLQHHYRSHVVRANTSAMEPNLSASSKQSEVNHGCGGGGGSGGAAEVVIPQPPTPANDPPSPIVPPARVAPTGSAVSLPTGGTRQTPFVVVAGAEPVTGGMGLGWGVVVVGVMGVVGGLV